MENKSNSIKQIATQFFLIVFSVVLGLYLSERIEDRKKSKESDELLATLIAEVQDNLILLNKWVPYHQEMRGIMDSLAESQVFLEEFISNKYTIYDKLLTKGTFMGRSPASDAWDIAKSHPLIVNIDYDKWVIMSRIYNQQESTFEPALDMIKLLESPGANSEEDAQSNLEAMSSYMLDFTARERQLMAYYNKAAEIFDLSAVEE